MGESFLWYRLTQIVPDKIQRAVKQLYVMDILRKQIEGLCSYVGLCIQVENIVQWRCACNEHGIVKC